MYNVTLNTPAEGLERDEQGHRTGFKLLIRVRRPMSDTGYLRWGRIARRSISKSKWVWQYYASTKAMGLPNGVPIQLLSDDKTMAEYLIPTFLLTEGYTYSLQGWTPAKTKTHVKVTKTLALITVHDAENLKYTVTNTARLNRYWFRQPKKKQTRTL